MFPNIVANFIYKLNEILFVVFCYHIFTTIFISHYSILGDRGRETNRPTALSVVCHGQNFKHLLAVEFADWNKFLLDVYFLLRKGVDLAECYDK